MINRHNYEEFFLLYADKELDADEQTAVESFVKQNPDLAKELDMLQQATLTDDHIQFKQKELLYKKEKGISLANYEEYFLLHADNELNEQEIVETNHFVLQHPQLQNEFILLQQTRLEPELIEFPDKENLYRKEKKVRRIIPFAMVRVGAAAAVAGIIYISFIVLNTNNNSNSNIVTATTEKSAKKAEKIDNQIQKSLTEKFIVSSDVKKENKNKLKKASVASRKSVKYNRETITEIKSSEKASLANKSKTNLKKETLNTNINIISSEKTTDRQAYSPPKQIGIKLSDNNGNSKILNDLAKDKSDNVKQTIIEKQPALAVHAVYLEIDNDEEEKSVYVGGAEINKNKLKGLFKKATGFLNKKIHENDN